MRTSLGLGLALSAVTFLVAYSAAAADPYIVLQDDGTIENNAFMTVADEKAVEKKLLALYDATGAELPEIISVWSTFKIGADVYGTYFDPISNDAKGIGLQTAYGGDGTFKSPTPPLRSILFHNDVLVLSQRAAIQSAPVDGFARYLFLLELSHNWGPALNVPGSPADELVGFPFHWSFWMDAGGSPAGGNAWKDNGDGTFSTSPATPTAIHYSKVDEYIMGLAAAGDVTPFGVLENAVPPAGMTDPLWGGAYAAHSFPWFAAAPLTVTATRRTLTIDDVVTANGARDPAAGAAQTSWKLAIVLLVSGKDTPAQIATAKTTFDPIASDFVPSFHEATDNLGTLDLILPPLPDGGIGGGGGAGGNGAGGNANGGGGAQASTGSSTPKSTSPAAEPSSGCGCRVADAGDPGESAIALGLIGIALAIRGSSRRRLKS